MVATAELNFHCLRCIRLFHSVPMCLRVPYGLIPRASDSLPGSQSSGGDGQGMRCGIVVPVCEPSVAVATRKRWFDAARAAAPDMAGVEATKNTLFSERA